jgi:hypothetical protein
LSFRFIDHDVAAGLWPSEHACADSNGAERDFQATN